MHFNRARPHARPTIIRLRTERGVCMGERTILVCDVCGRPAVESVTIKAGRANWTKDLCQVHLDELTSGARKPRPGRRVGTLATPGVTASGKRRGRPPGSKNKNL